VIGVFDSGIGGLSVLRALRAELPSEHFTYFADTAHAPFGERDEAFVAQRSLTITHELVERHGAKLVVVACNTATAAAIHLLRDAHTKLPIVGIEPALKPAAQATKTGKVGVMATRGTLASAKFDSLLRGLQGKARFVLQPCDGLAHAIEAGDEAQVRSLCQRYAGAILETGDVDTLVLGCTHYAFAHEVLRAIAGPGVAIMEPGAAVARRVRSLLGAPRAQTMGGVSYEASGNAKAIEDFALRLDQVSGFRA
jgi:glutamate racemase